MKSDTTHTVTKDRWSSYSALAQSFRKTHNDQELLRAAAKGALSLALPLTLATLPPQTAKAQAAICSSTSNQVTLAPGYGVNVDVDNDGIIDLIFGYIYQSANWRQLVVSPRNGAGIGCSRGLVNNYYPLNLQSGTTISTAAFPYLIADSNLHVLYSLYNGTPYGNFKPGIDPPGNIGLQTTNGNMGWVGLTVSGLGNFTITFIGAEGAAPDSNGGVDGFGVAVIDNCATLPVELTYFKAQASAKTIQLNWATASETNNAGFEIQRSKDGERFRKIGFAKGHGTTVEAQEYTFEDNDVFANTTYYYRLKQVDEDGSFAYSDVQTVILKNETAIEVSDFFPNPATTEVQFQDNTAAEGTAIIELFNSTGQQLRIFQQGVQTGANTLNLHVADLPKGTYFAKVKAGEQQVYKKLVITD